MRTSAVTVTSPKRAGGSDRAQRTPRSSSRDQPASLKTTTMMLDTHNPTRDAGDGRPSGGEHDEDP